MIVDLHQEITNAVQCSAYLEINCKEGIEIEEAGTGSASLDIYLEKRIFLFHRHASISNDCQAPMFLCFEIYRQNYVVHLGCKFLFK